MTIKVFLLLFGPNLNQIEKRDSSLYGNLSLAEIAKRAQEHFEDQEVRVVMRCSNHEGALIDTLQEFSEQAAGIIFNPGALSHYSYALHDAILDVRCPVVEVHFSNIHAREEFRRTSVTAPACDGVVVGLGWKGLIAAISSLLLPDDGGVE
jgi:3-dehydroquinate dehydratase-2